RDRPRGARRPAPEGGRRGVREVLEGAPQRHRDEDRSTEEGRLSTPAEDRWPPPSPSARHGRRSRRTTTPYAACTCARCSPRIRSAASVSPPRRAVSTSTTRSTG